MNLQMDGRLEKAICGPCAWMSPSGCCPLAIASRTSPSQRQPAVMLFLWCAFSMLDQRTLRVAPLTPPLQLQAREALLLRTMQRWQGSGSPAMQQQSEARTDGRQLAQRDALRAKVMACQVRVCVCGVFTPCVATRLILLMSCRTCLMLRPGCAHKRCFLGHPNLRGWRRVRLLTPQLLRRTQTLCTATPLCVAAQMQMRWSAADAMTSEKRPVRKEHTDELLTPGRCSTPDSHLLRTQEFSNCECVGLLLRSVTQSLEGRRLVLCQLRQRLAVNHNVLRRKAIYQLVVFQLCRSELVSATGHRQADKDHRVGANT